MSVAKVTSASLKSAVWSVPVADEDEEPVLDPPFVELLSSLPTPQAVRVSAAATARAAAARHFARRVTPFPEGFSVSGFVYGARRTEARGVGGT